MPRGRNLYDGLYQHLVSMPHGNDDNDNNDNNDDNDDSAPNFLMTCSAWRMQQYAGEACINMLPRDLEQICLLEDMRNCAGCDVLMTRPAAMRCAVCRVEYYCSLRCQKAHWPTHKKVCASISKRDRLANEAMQTASRIAWVLYTQKVRTCTQVKTSTLHMMPQKFALDTRDCLLAKFKPDAHDRLLTLVLLTKKQAVYDAPRTPVANTRQVLVATFLEPQKLMVALKTLLRNSISSELMESLKGEDKYLLDTMQDFRNSVVQLHTLVKKATSTDSMLERTRKQTHLFVLITPMQRDWCNLLCFRCMEMQANFNKHTSLCAELVSEFGLKDRVDHEQEVPEQDMRADKRREK